jgi:hypothetical protein
MAEYNQRPDKLVLWRPSLQQHFMTGSGTGDYFDRDNAAWEKLQKRVDAGYNQRAWQVGDGTPGPHEAQCTARAQATATLAGPITGRRGAGRRGWRSDVEWRALNGTGQCAHVLRGELEAMDPRWDVHHSRNCNDQTSLDCTHWCYDQTLWEPLWDAIARQVLNKFSSAAPETEATAAATAKARPTRAPALCV